MKAFNYSRAKHQHFYLLLASTLPATSFAASPSDPIRFVPASRSACLRARLLARSLFRCLPIREVLPSGRSVPLSFGQAKSGAGGKSPSPKWTDRAHEFIYKEKRRFLTTITTTKSLYIHIYISDLNIVGHYIILSKAFFSKLLGFVILHS